MQPGTEQEKTRAARALRGAAGGLGLGMLVGEAGSSGS